MQPALLTGKRVILFEVKVNRTSGGNAETRSYIVELSFRSVLQPDIGFLNRSNPKNLISEQPLFSNIGPGFKIFIILYEVLFL